MSPTIILRIAPGGFAWTRILTAFLAYASVLRAQDRPLAVEDLKLIYASADESLGWGERQVPEFVAAAYGPRARTAVLAILAEPSTKTNYGFQAAALRTAQYGRVGVPTEILMLYATGSKEGSAGSGLRGHALRALSMRADSLLAPFWQRLFREERHSSYRQHAPAGLACALGVKALPDLELMRQDPDPAVARVAEFHHADLTRSDRLALACGGRVSREHARDFPQTLHPYLRERGSAILLRVP